MARFILSTRINAPAGICFDLARSIDLHLMSMRANGEKAIAGVRSGLIGLNETVTWRARHFGMFVKLTSKITEFRYPEIFSDEMVSGPFKLLAHRHQFLPVNGYTLMIDEFVYTPPLGVLGKLADSLFLKRYMLRLIRHRNQTIKEEAEMSPGASPI